MLYGCAPPEHFFTFGGMFDLESEDPIPLITVANRFDVSLSTALRWHLRGTRAPSGERVHLEARRVGRSWFTSWAAVERYSDALTTNGRQIPRSHTRRQRDNLRAKAVLTAAGF